MCLFEQAEMVECELAGASPAVFESGTAPVASDRRFEE
tara:strand:- start:1723 stop:1836 length:114 start_codon:yes stop_codon:yes gene_type:complete